MKQNRIRDTHTRVSAVSARLIRALLFLFQVSKDAKTRDETRKSVTS